MTFRHVVEYADGWMPIEGRWPITEKLVELRKAAEAAGRDPDSLTIGVFALKPEAAHIEAQMAAGVTIGALSLPSAPRDKVLSLLDRYGELVERFHAA